VPEIELLCPATGTFVSEVSMPEGYLFVPEEPLLALSEPGVTDDAVPEESASRFRIRSLLRVAN